MPLAVPLIIGGIALDAYGKWQQGKAAKKAGDLTQAAAEDQAQLTEYNAAVTAVQSKDAVQRGLAEENKFRSGVKSLIGSQRAGFAGANVDVNFGSAVDVQADAAFLGELDALTIRTNAAREAWGYNVQGEDLRRTASIQRKEGAAAAATGRQQQTAARIGAVTGAVAGTSNLLMAKYGLGKK